MSPKIVPIVEGQAEVGSVPVLLRRLLAELGAHEVQVARPLRVRRNQFVREGEAERAIQLAVRSREGVGCILVILDADDDCPASLGPELLARCADATRRPVAVVIANRELEAWFLGAKESLRGVRGIQEDATAPPDPEAIRGAKERLSHNMRGRRYLEVDDQPALAAEMSLEAAESTCPSFAKLRRDVAGLVQRLALNP